MQNRTGILKLSLKRAILFFLFLQLAAGISAQTLFTYNGREVSKDDFLRAYGKNNATGKATEKSYRDYLDLYIRYKLKVQAAYDAKMDTLPAQSSELQYFRNQTVENFMNEADVLNKMVSEAFVRGQKDLHLAHIFIAVLATASPSDTAKAWEKITAAYGQLKQGKDFGETAAQYSQDPLAVTNKGDVGYITVFSLPYELETVAYSLAPGHYSKPFRTRGGYHIFKNLGERKAFGKMRAAQILLAFPIQANEADKAVVRGRADSIYRVLKKGGDFGSLAKQFSGDNLSYQTGGEMAEFGAGRYEPAFEAAAFALDKDEAISQPVLSSYGYHIIKRLGRKPFPSDSSKEVLGLLKQETMNDARIDYSRKAMLDKVFRLTQFNRAPFSEENLWVFTDSALKNKPLTTFKGINDQTVLFSFSAKSKTVKEWVAYLKVILQMPGGAGKKTKKELFDQFIQTSAFDYYKEHLENYNKDFAFQLAEFREGNLLFEVMQHTIWDKASSDSVGLLAFYEAHKDKYQWEPSADAILFSTANEKAATDLQNKLLQDPKAWRKWVDASGGLVQADSGRFELSQIPVAERTRFAAGQLTSFVKNQADNTVSFSYIVQDYPVRSPRSYKDARGFVINDYQGYLEEQWVSSLRKKYPVHIDEKVFNSLPK